MLSSYLSRASDLDHAYDFNTYDLDPYDLDNYAHDHDAYDIDGYNLASRRSRP